jgi:polysaccharide export outer membrane protein
MIPANLNAQLAGGRGFASSDQRSDFGRNRRKLSYGPGERGNLPFWILEVGEAKFSVPTPDAGCVASVKGVYPMTLDLNLKKFRRCCRNQPGGTVETCLAAVIIIFSGALVPLWCQAPPAAASTNPGAPQPSTKSAMELRANSEDYEISPDDLLEIYVVDVEQLSRTYRVSPNGSIHLPLLSDSIAAAGLTPSQLSDAIRDRLISTRLIGNPKVTVEVKESRVHSVAITGAVKRPQIYPVFGQTTFVDLLSQAEGLADDAGNTAIIQRGEAAQRRLGLKKAVEDGQQPMAPSSVTVDLKQLLEGGDAASNPIIYPGDRVTVPHAGVFYVLGAVNRPGGFNLRDAQEPITVLMALATAGDLTTTAKSHSAVLIRKNAQAPDGSEHITLNLKEVLSGALPDQRMQADDVLFVPESSGKKAGRAMLSAFGVITTSTTSGVLVYRR